MPIKSQVRIFIIVHDTHHPMFEETEVEIRLNEPIIAKLEKADFPSGGEADKAIF